MARLIAVGCGSQASNLAEGGGERARLAEPDLEPNLRHGRIGTREKLLGPLDPPPHVIAVWGEAERLLEDTAEMIGAEAHESGEFLERYPLGEMFLDISGDRALLPGGETAS